MIKDVVPTVKVAEDCAQIQEDDLANYVKPVQTQLNGYPLYRLAVKRTLVGHTVISYLDISCCEQVDAERLAAEYAVRHEIPLLLDDDPDGRLAEVAMQQAFERMEQADLSTLWMQ